MLIINYVVDDVNIDDRPDAENINYTNNVTVKTPTKGTTQLQANEIKTKYKNLKQTINEKINQLLKKPTKKKKKNQISQKDDDTAFVKIVPLHPRKILKS